MKYTRETSRLMKRWAPAFEQFKRIEDETRKEEMMKQLHQVLQSAR